MLGFLAGAAGKLLGKAGKWAVKQAIGSGKKAVKKPVETALTAIGGGTVLSPVLTALTKPTTSATTKIDQGFGPDLNPFGTNDRSGAIFGFGGKLRRARRINYTNMRALKKSIRRVQGFEKLARDVFTIGKGGLTLKKARRR